MKLIVSNKSDKPIYEQLYGQISAAVLSGELKGDTMLPSIRGVANELGVSIITVKNAYKALERDGYIYTRDGKGCFVSSMTGLSMELWRTGMATKKLNEAVKYSKSLGCTDEDIKMIIKEIL